MYKVGCFIFFYFIFQKCNNNLVELVNKLLTIDPRLRPKAKQLLKLDIFYDKEESNDFNPNGVL